MRTRAVSVHVEGGAGWDGGVAPFDVFDRGAREADGDDGPEAENFFVEGRDEGDLFLVKTAFPGVVIRVDFVNLGKSFGLELLPVRA